jgi:hypothetical protein
MKVAGDDWDDAVWEGAEKTKGGKAKASLLLAMAGMPLDKKAAQAGAQQTLADINAWKADFRTRKRREPNSQEMQAIRSKYDAFRYYKLASDRADVLVKKKHPSPQASPVKSAQNLLTQTLSDLDIVRNSNGSWTSRKDESRASVIEELLLVTRTLAKPKPPKVETSMEAKAEAK